MPNEVKPSFAFLVLTYNHENYILEHLESIKYLVLTYGANTDVDLIVSDDCSRDKTRELVDSWLNINAPIFRHVKIIYNTKNMGTCASVNNMLDCMKADRCKLTAGDDVYSYENIFELTKCEPDIAILSGRSLYLHDEVLSVDFKSTILSTATQIIYENEKLLHRFKHISYNNAPNILYATECLLHPGVRAELARFDVTEDWPLQVAIASEFPNYKFKLIEPVLVYYRRTAGSTYLVANQRFVKDKILMFDTLIEKETSLFEKFRLKSRKLCFSISGKFSKKIINIDAYLFIGSMVMNAKGIYSAVKAIKLDEARHKNHYTMIKSAAKNIDIKQ